MTMSGLLDTAKEEARRATRGLQFRSAVWNVFWAIVFLGALRELRDLWRWALANQSPETATSQDVTTPAARGKHEWRINGGIWKADHISTTLPDYMGSRGFAVTGYTETNDVLWQLNSVDKLEQIR